MRKYIANSSVGVLDFDNYMKRIQEINNPLLVHFTEISEDEGCIILTRPFLTGLPLDEWLKLTSAKDINVTFVLWKLVLRAIHHLHQYGIAPNYIKPSNIIIDGCTPKLVDLYQKPSRETMGFIATDSIILGYLPPELYQNRELSKFSDVWSLGVLLFYMISGELPWNCKNLMLLTSQIVNGDLQQIHANPSVPADIKSMVLQMLKSTPSERTEPRALLEINPGVHVHRPKRTHNKTKHSNHSHSPGLRSVGSMILTTKFQALTPVTSRPQDLVSREAPPAFRAIPGLTARRPLPPIVRPKH